MIWLGTPRAHAPEQGDNAENGPSNGNWDNWPGGALRGALAGGNETAGYAVD